MSDKKKNKHLIKPSDVIAPSFDPTKTLYDWSPENTNWDDPTVCALCGKVDCICTLQRCPCGKYVTYCEWPSQACPCPLCEKFKPECECDIVVKEG